MSTRLELDAAEFEKLEIALKEYEGNAEEAINDALHNEAAQLIQDSVRRLIPESGKSWKGKKGAAKDSNSLMQENGNLSVTVKTTKNYQYLYFPDDGTNTRRHVGNQQFFYKGGEKVVDDVIERCLNRLKEF